MTAAAFPCDLPAARRQAIVAALKASYARHDATQFPGSATVPCPPLGPGRSQSVLDWLYPALHLTLEPRPDQAAADRDLARRMILRAIRQGQHRVTGHPADGVWHWAITDATIAGETDFPRDRNTAGFMGCALVRIWASDPHKLADWPAADFDLFKDAVRRSVDAGLRWWVRVGYTNPQCLDFYLGWVAADLLGDPSLRDRTREHLETFLAYARTTETFEEYLSPTYMAVNLTGLVPLAHYARSTPDAALLSDLLAQTWRHIGQSAHTPTGELCAPHARAYGDTAIERADHLYGWLHLAAPEAYPMHLVDAADSPAERVAQGGFFAWFQREPRVFDGLAAPGLYVPLGLPRDVRKELTAKFRRPVERRVVTEWIGRCGWKPPYDLSKPQPPAPRFRLATRCRAANFCLGSINEQDSWRQRRSVVAYWKDAAGRTTGVKWFVKVDADAQAAKHLGDWLFQQALELITLQAGPHVIGAWRTATVVEAHPGDRLGTPASVSGLSPTSCEPRQPVGWFLGSHWRQAIEPEWRTQRLGRLVAGLAPIGAGQWESLDATGTRWQFVENGIALSVETPAGARLQAIAARTGNTAPVECLTLASEENLAWDWLALPQLLLPFGASVQASGKRPIWGLTVNGSAQAFELERAELKLRWQAPTGPADIERRTWFGWVDGREILPEGFY